MNIAPMTESLRGSYMRQSQNWSFNPPESSSSVLGSMNHDRTESPQWTKHASFSNGSSSLFSSTNFNPLARALLTSAALQYCSTAIAMPWEVGRLLLQVQYTPKGAVIESESPEEENSDESSNDNDELYFSDIPSQNRSTSSKRRKTDERGYILKSKLSGRTRPFFVLPLDNPEGVWSMVKRLGRFRPEGWLSLFKGLLTTSMIDFLSSLIEPMARSVFNTLFEKALTSGMDYDSTSRILVSVLAHLTTGFIISPLDLVRTRLVVQSSVPRYRTYKGFLDALSQILRNEGGLRGIYLHPQLLYPTLLDCTIRPLVGFGMPYVVSHILGSRVTMHSHPLLWSIAQLAGATFGLLFTLPVETARRRLQVQTRGSAVALNACVELNPTPYRGVLDVIVSILRDETTRVHRDVRVDDTDKDKKHSDRNKGSLLTAEEQKSNQGSGVGQLYHGLTTRVVANALILLGPLFVINGSDDGWTEL